jgi:hypothetical protein
LLIVLNSGRRAFRGAVLVRCRENPELTAPWARGMTLRELIESYGAAHVEELTGDAPTIAIGRPLIPAGTLITYPAAYGWSGVTASRPPILALESNAISQVLAAALAVSECFQHVRGNVVACRRSVGYSIWRPELAWDDPAAEGPELSFLPQGLWLLGLGHLGQAYAWVLGCLPYSSGDVPRIYLQDFDHVTEANIATSLLSSQNDERRLKTRVTAQGLERLGFETRLIERPFTGTQMPADDEPDWALAGFHGIEPRKDLYRVPFGRSVDVGLGATSSTYMDILLQTLPSDLPLEELWPAPRRLNQGERLHELPAYRHALERRIAMGENERDARCGVITVAGRAVGASFVGAAAAALAVGDLLRALHGGRDYRVVELDLRNPRPSQGQPKAGLGLPPRYGYLGAAK